MQASALGRIYVRSDLLDTYLDCLLDVGRIFRWSDLLDAYLDCLLDARFMACSGEI